MQRWQLISGAVAVASLVAVVSVFLDSDHGDGGATRIDDAANGAPMILAADAGGVVVANREGLIGLARDGEGASWELPADDFAPLHVVCAPTCPAAIASSDSLNLNSPLAPDPAPRKLGGAALSSALSAETGGKSAILSAEKGAALRLGTDDQGDGTWTSAGSSSARSFPAPTTFVDWLPNTDGSAAVAAWQDGEHRVQQLWKPGKQGWRPVSDVERSADGYGCAAGGGARWLIDGRHIESRNGPATPIELDGSLSNCGFTKDRLVVTAYTLSGEGAETSVAVFALDGSLVFTHTHPAEMAISTDVESDRFALVGDRQALVYDRNGSLVKRVRGVASARFVEDGSLVVIDDDGHATWRRV